jgi:hypothetical protein
MSSSVHNLSNEDYEERKRILTELKKLVKPEQEQIFLILKRYKVDYSENSNGVFFDLNRVPKEPFDEIRTFLTFCQTNRKDFEARDKQMESSRLSLGENSFETQ